MFHSGTSCADSTGPACEFLIGRRGQILSKTRRLASRKKPAFAFAQHRENQKSEPVFNLRMCIAD